MSISQHTAVFDLKIKKVRKTVERDTIEKERAMICNHCKKNIPSHTNLCSCGEIASLEQVSEEVALAGSGQCPSEFHPVLFEKLYDLACVEDMDEELVQQRKNQYTELYVPEGVTELAGFQDYQNLHSLYLPESLKVVQSLAFAGCSSLEEVDFPQGLETFRSLAFDGCPWLSQIEEDFVVIGDGICIQCHSEEEELVFPNHVKVIGHSACFELPCVSVVFPEGLRSIESDAFKNCQNLEEIHFPQSLDCIEMYAFENCSALETVSFPENVAYIGRNAFTNTPFYRSILENFCKNKQYAQLVTWGSRVLFHGYGLRTLQIPSSITSITAKAFEFDTHLEEIILPDTITDLGESSFLGCSSLHKVELSSSLSILPPSLFFHCGELAAIRIPSNIKKILDCAFYGCRQLEHITLEEGVEEIGDYAFGNCQQLKSVTLPSSVKYLGDGVFKDCVNLESVEFLGFIPQLPHSMFSGCNQLKTLKFINPVHQLEPFSLELPVAKRLYAQFPQKVMDNYMYLQPKWDSWEEEHTLPPLSQEEWILFLEEAVTYEN